MAAATGGAALLRYGLTVLSFLFSSGEGETNWICYGAIKKKDLSGEEGRRVGP
jgi:hypothetical protein